MLYGPTQLARHLQLGSGRFLSPSESRVGAHFVASWSGASDAQVGRILALPGTTHVAVRPLKEAFGAVPVAGQYYVEPTGRARADTFTTVLAASLSKQLDAQVTREQLAPFGTMNPGPRGNTDGLLRAAYNTLLLLVVLLAVYLQLHQAKRDAVLRLHGYTSTAAWFQQGGSLVLLLTAGVMLLAVISAVVIPGVTIGLGVDMAIQTGLAGTLIALGTLVARRYLVRIPLGNSLKNRKDTRGLFTLNTAVKGVCAIAVIVTGAGLWNQYQAALGTQWSLQDWAKARDYGVSRLSSCPTSRF